MEPHLRGSVKTHHDYSSNKANSGYLASMKVRLKFKRDVSWIMF